MLRRRTRNEARPERSGTQVQPARTAERQRSGRAEAQAGSGASAERSGHSSEPFTYIQRGTTILGRLEASGRVRVPGVVKGDVKVDGALEVAEAGLVEGSSVEAADVKIIGKVVVERLVASGKVEIWDGGELIGDVTAASLDIEEGARFTGRSEMAGPTEPREAPAAALPALGAAADSLLEESEVGRP